MSEQSSTLSDLAGEVLSQLTRITIAEDARRPYLRVVLPGSQRIFLRLQQHHSGRVTQKTWAVSYVKNGAKVPQTRAVRFAHDDEEAARELFLQGVMNTMGRNQTCRLELMQDDHVWMQAQLSHNEESYWDKVEDMVWIVRSAI